tara:strand:+ start:1429 stop:2193 length:765 start_codon:yes stop_codon:yes gene_type:complete
MSRIRANTITNQNANGAPNFPDGLTVTGVVTATVSNSTLGTLSVTGDATVGGTLGVGGTLTYEDVTNIDSVGLITARSGMKIGPTAGVAGTFFADGSYVTAGIITATNVSVASSVTAATFHGNGANLTGIQGIPSGVIMMWSGAADAIPSGFVLCNGQNSTPDLRNRFVVGATDTYSVGATGGATSTNAVLGSVVVYTGTEDNPNQVQDASSSYNGINNKNSRDRHQHGTDINHTHSNIPTLPPYYALCYIMKT